jgi:dTDP-glucose 4,6-dehydratase
MRLNDGRVIPAFIGQALRGEDLTILATECKLVLCYVDDQVEGILDCCIQTMCIQCIGNQTKLQSKILQMKL